MYSLPKICHKCENILEVGLGFNLASTKRRKSIE